MFCSFRCFARPQGDFEKKLSLHCSFFSLFHSIFISPTKTPNSSDGVRVVVFVSVGAVFFFEGRE